MNVKAMLHVHGTMVLAFFRCLHVADKRFTRVWLIKCLQLNIVLVCQGFPAEFHFTGIAPCTGGVRH